MKRRARGIFNTIIKSMENLLGSNVTSLIMKEVSSLVTDGTSVNTGHINGLWEIFQDYRLENFSNPYIIYLQYGVVNTSQVWHGRPQAMIA